MLYSLVQKYRRKRKGEKDERARDGLAIELAVCSDKEALSGLLSAQQGRPGRGSIYLLLHTTRLYIGTYLSLSLCSAVYNYFIFSPGAASKRSLLRWKGVASPAGQPSADKHTHTQNSELFAVGYILYIFFQKRKEERRTK